MEQACSVDKVTNVKNPKQVIFFPVNVAFIYMQ